MKRKSTKILAGIGIVLAAVLLLSGGIGYGILHYYHSLLDFQPTGENNLTEPNEPVSDETDTDFVAPPATETELSDLEQQLKDNLLAMQNSSMQDENVMNILLVGVDSRSNDFKGRSDVMLLLSVNKQSKRIVASSFLRDIYVSIPGSGSNRLNAAYAFGGTSLLCDTLQANFGITVDRCVVINFFLAMEFIDAVGGVDLEISDAEIKVLNNYINEHNTLLGLPQQQDKLKEGTGGTHHLNGSQAVAYARIRYVGNGDFGRTERQRKIGAEVFQKIRQMPLSQLNDLAHTFLPKIRTDLTEGDCAYLLLQLPQLGSYQVESMAIPKNGSFTYMTVRRMSVLAVDFAQNSALWKEAVYGSDQPAS